MPKKYRIHLTEAQRVELKALIAAGKAAAPKRLRAQILLAADDDHPGGALRDGDIVRALGVSVCTVERTRCALAEHDLQTAVHGRPPQRQISRRQISRRQIDGSAEAHLVAAACGTPPEGRSRWTPGRSPGDPGPGGERQPPDHWQSPSKNELKPWQVQQWCLPPQGSAAFVRAMEDVLEVQARPRDPLRPLVCLDEFRKTVHRRSPGSPARTACPAGLGVRPPWHVQRVHGLQSTGIPPGLSVLQLRMRSSLPGQATASEIWCRISAGCQFCKATRNSCLDSLEKQTTQPNRKYEHSTTHYWSDCS